MKLRPFFCWLLTGHNWDKTGSSIPASRTMNYCIYCNKEYIGDE